MAGKRTRKADRLPPGLDRRSQIALGAGGSAAHAASLVACWANDVVTVSIVSRRSVERRAPFPKLHRLYFKGQQVPHFDRPKHSSRSRYPPGRR
jgi:hypothetical protein